MRFTGLFAASLAVLAAVVSADTPAPGAPLAAPSPICQTTQEAYKATREAFAGMRNCQLYTLSAITNDDPTRSELQEATKWQLGEVEKAMKKASDYNAQDPKFVRKAFISAKLKYLGVEVKYFKNLLSKPLKKAEGLSKAMNWTQAVLPKLSDLLRTMFKGPGSPPPPPFDIAKFVSDFDGKINSIDQHMYDIINKECRS